MIGAIKNAAARLLKPQRDVAAKPTPPLHQRDVFADVDKGRLDVARRAVGAQDADALPTADPMDIFGASEADLDLQTPGASSPAEDDAGSADTKLEERPNATGGSNPAGGRQDPGQRSGLW